MSRTRHILIVDDDAADRALVRRAVAKVGGWSVGEAADLRSAEEQLSADPRPDVVLSDLHLPDGTPQELADRPDRAYALVVVSGLDAETLERTHPVAGADAVVAKEAITPAMLGGLLARLAARARPSS